MNERIIALDIGDARIGVAVSDASRLIATPIDTIYRVGYGPDVRKVVEICQRYDTTQVLSGWPKRSKRFANSWKKRGFRSSIRMNA